MRIIKEAGKETAAAFTKDEWLLIGEKAGWLNAEAKKKKTPKQHGFVDQCIKENSDKDSPGGYCASIVDKVKGSTSWRKGPKSDKS